MSYVRGLARSSSWTKATTSEENVNHITNVRSTEDSMRSQSLPRMVNAYTMPQNTTDQITPPSPRRAYGAYRSAPSCYAEAPAHSQTLLRTDSTSADETPPAERPVRRAYSTYRSTPSGSIEASLRSYSLPRTGMTAANEIFHTSAETRTGRPIARTQRRMAIRARSQNTPSTSLTEEKPSTAQSQPVTQPKKYVSVSKAASKKNNQKIAIQVSRVAPKAKSIDVAAFSRPVNSLSRYKSVSRKTSTTSDDGSTDEDVSLDHLTTKLGVISSKNAEREEIKEELETILRQKHSDEKHRDYWHQRLIFTNEKIEKQAQSAQEKEESTLIINKLISAKMMVSTLYQIFQDKVQLAKEKEKKLQQILLKLDQDAFDDSDDEDLTPEEFLKSLQGSQSNKVPKVAIEKMLTQEIDANLQSKQIYQKQLNYWQQKLETLNTQIKQFELLDIEMPQATIAENFAVFEMANDMHQLFQDEIELLNRKSTTIRQELRKLQASMKSFTGAGIKKTKTEDEELERSQFSLDYAKEKVSTYKQKVEYWKTKLSTSKEVFSELDTDEEHHEDPRYKILLDSQKSIASVFTSFEQRLIAEKDKVKKLSNEIAIKKAALFETESSASSSSSKEDSLSEDETLGEILTTFFSYSEEAESDLQKPVSPIREALTQKSDSIPLISYDETDLVSIKLSACIDLLNSISLRVNEIESEKVQEKIMRNITLAHAAVLEHHDEGALLTKQGIAILSHYLKRASIYATHINLRNLLSLLGKHFKVAWLSKEFYDSRESSEFLKQPGASTSQSKSFDLGAGVGMGAGVAATGIMGSAGYASVYDEQTRDDGATVSGKESTKKIGFIGKSVTGFAPTIKGSVEGQVTSLYVKKTAQVNDDDQAGASSAAQVLRGVTRKRHVKETPAFLRAVGAVLGSSKLLDYKRKAINAINSLDELNALIKKVLRKSYTVSVPNHVYIFAKELVSSSEKAVEMKGIASASAGLSLIEAKSAASAVMSKKHIVEARITPLEKAIINSEIDPDELPSFMLETVLTLIGKRASEQSLSHALFSLQEDLNEYMAVVGRYDYVKEEIRQSKQIVMKSTVKKQLKMLKVEAKKLKALKTKIEERWQAKNRGQFLQIISASVGFIKLQCQQFGIKSLDSVYFRTVHTLRHPSIQIEAMKFINLTSILQQSKSSEIIDGLSFEVAAGPVLGKVAIKKTKIFHPNPFRAGNFVSLELNLSTSELGAMVSNIALALNMIKAEIQAQAGLTLDLFLDIKAEMIENKECSFSYSFYKPFIHHENLDFYTPSYQREYLRILDGKTVSKQLKGDTIMPGISFAGQIHAAAREASTSVRKEILGENSLRYLVMRHIGFLNTLTYLRSWREFCKENIKELKVILRNIFNPSQPIHDEINLWIQALIIDAPTEKAAAEIEELSDNLLKSINVYIQNPIAENLEVALEYLRRVLVKLSAYAVDSEDKLSTVQKPTFRKP